VITRPVLAISFSVERALVSPVMTSSALNGNTTTTQCMCLLCLQNKPNVELYWSLSFEVKKTSHDGSNEPKLEWMYKGWGVWWTRGVPDGTEDRQDFWGDIGWRESEDQRRFGGIWVISSRIGLRVVAQRLTRDHRFGRKATRRPLYEIRVKQREERRKLLDNPLKLKKLKNILQSTLTDDRQHKKSKKRHKRRDSSSSDGSSDESASDSGTVNMTTKGIEEIETERVSAGVTVEVAVRHHTIHHIIPRVVTQRVMNQIETKTADIVITIGETILIADGVTKKMHSNDRRDDRRAPPSRPPVDNRNKTLPTYRRIHGHRRGQDSAPKIWNGSAKRWKRTPFGGKRSARVMSGRMQTRNGRRMRWMPAESPHNSSNRCWRAPLNRTLLEADTPEAVHLSEGLQSMDTNFAKSNRFDELCGLSAGIHLILLPFLRLHTTGHYSCAPFPSKRRSLHLFALPFHIFGAESCPLRWPWMRRYRWKWFCFCYRPVASMAAPVDRLSGRLNAFSGHPVCDENRLSDCYH